MEQLELPLWQELKNATIAPYDANLSHLLQSLECSLLELNTTTGQLQVASEAIAQIAQVVCDRATLLLEELEATTHQEGPIMAENAFDRYVRQTMEVDLDSFIDPLPSLPRTASEPSEFIPDNGSVVGELNREALLKALDEQIRQEPTLTEIEIFNRALNVAHPEDISAWSGAIREYLQKQPIQSISLQELSQALGLVWIEVWLGLLLGNFQLESQGEFYASDVFVSVLEPEVSRSPSQ